jgi:phospholipid/cholesterol/gamma-HCH transport system permease protein
LRHSSELFTWKPCTVTESLAARLRRSPLASVLELLGEVATLTAHTFRVGFSRPFQGRELARQIVQIGQRSMTIVLLTALFSAMVITVQFALQLTRFGAKSWVGSVVGVTLARELGPVMTALVVGGRVGAGIAAELGSMAVTEQIDAIRVLGADPVRKLVAPRVFAAMISLPLMTAMAVVLGVVGGAFIASIDAGVSFRHFYDSAWHATTMSDFLSGLTKTVFFGYDIAIVACQRGLATRGGTEGVGRATTETVVITSVITLISDFLLTKLILTLDGG